MTLGQRIAELRAEAQLTQEELAEQMGVSRQSVSKWETDASVPELDKLIQISRLFGVTLDELVGNESTQKSADFVFDSDAAFRGELAHAETEEPYEPDGQSSLRFLRAQRLVGCVLTAAAAAALVLCDGYTPLMLLLTVFCVLCGVLCMVLKEHTGRVLLLLTGIFLLLPMINMLFDEITDWIERLHQ